MFSENKYLGEHDIPLISIYISALKADSRFQDKEQLYPYLAIHKPLMHNQSLGLSYDHSTLVNASSAIDDLTG